MYVAHDLTQSRHTFLSPTIFSPFSYVDVLLEDLPFLALTVYVTQQLGLLNLQVGKGLNWLQYDYLAPMLDSIGLSRLLSPCPISV